MDFIPGDSMYNRLRDINKIEVPIATIIIEYILKNFNRTNWNNKNNSINSIMTQIALKLNYKDCTDLLINKILDLLKIFHLLKMEDKHAINYKNWATTIFENVDKELLTYGIIPETTIINMIDMQHKGVVKVLVTHNIHARSCVEKDPLKFLKRACKKNGVFCADIIIFLIETFYPGDFSIEDAEIIAYAIRYEANAYEEDYDKHENIRKLVSTIISKTQYEFYSETLMNHLLEILTKQYYVDESKSWWSVEKKDIWLMEHEKINFWREDMIKSLLKNNKLNKQISFDTFKNCIDKKYYKYLIMFSTISPRQFNVSFGCYTYKENRELEKKVNGTKNEILKKYHIFCYLIIMCDLVREPYDIKIIWHLLNVNEVIFNNNIYL